MCTGFCSTLLLYFVFVPGGQSCPCGTYPRILPSAAIVNLAENHDCVVSRDVNGNFFTEFARIYSNRGVDELESLLRKLRADDTDTDSARKMKELHVIGVPSRHHFHGNEYLYDKHDAAVISLEALELLHIRVKPESMSLLNVELPPIIAGSVRQWANDACHDLAFAVANASEPAEALNMMCCDTLRSLSLDSPQLSEWRFEYLQNCSSLRSVAFGTHYLRDSSRPPHRITSALQNLSNASSLRSVSLRHVKLDAVDIDALNRFNQLEQLSLSHCTLFVPHRDVLFSRTLRNIRLHNCEILYENNEARSIFYQLISSLESLEVAGQSKLISFSDLPVLEQLHSLSITGAGVTRSELLRLSCPNLRSLELSHIPFEIDNEVLNSIAPPATLAALIVRVCTIDNVNGALLARYAQLQRLAISKCLFVQDADVFTAFAGSQLTFLEFEGDGFPSHCEFLSRFHTLKHLNLISCSVSIGDISDAVSDLPVDSLGFSYMAMGMNEVVSLANLRTLRKVLFRGCVMTASSQTGQVTDGTETGSLGLSFEHILPILSSPSCRTFVLNGVQVNWAALLAALPHGSEMHTSEFDKILAFSQFDMRLGSE